MALASRMLMWAGMDAACELDARGKTAHARAQQHARRPYRATLILSRPEMDYAELPATYSVFIR